MAASEATQVVKKYPLFDSESYEEKAVKKPKGAEIAAEEGASMEPKIKLPSLITSQGLTVFSDIWYILGTAEQSELVPKVQQHLMFVHSKGVTLASVHCHLQNFGIWGREHEKVKYVVTLGEDLIDEANLQAKKGASSGNKIPGMVVKIWDAEQLLDNKYLPLSEYKKEVPAGKLLPRIVLFDSIIQFKDVACMDVSKDLTHIALGLSSGNVHLIKTTAKFPTNLCNCTDKDIQQTVLTPDPSLKLSVTNIHLYEGPDKSHPAYVIFCTCEKAFYMHNLAKKQTFTMITTGLGAMAKEMDAVDENIVICPQQTGEIRKYIGPNLEAKWPTKDKGVIISVTCVD